MLSDSYEQEQEELREKLLRLDKKINEQEEQAKNIDRFISKVKKYLDLDKLTPTVLNDMVKAVYVHTLDQSTGIGSSRLTFPMILWEYSHVFTGKPAKRRNGIARKLRRFPKTILCCFMSAALKLRPFYMSIWNAF